MAQLRHSPADPPRFAAIIVAAGTGTRAGQAIPKQYVRWRGKPVLRHSAESLLAAGAAPLVVAIAPDAADLAREALAGLDSIMLIEGGDTRRESVSAGLEALAVDAPERVLIHDAARPTLPQPVIDRVLAALATHPGAIPALEVVDTIARTKDGVMTGQEDRNTLARVQTPQGFVFDDILAAHRAWDNPSEPTDDAQVLRASGGEVAVVEGSTKLAKLTFAEDFAMQAAPVRTGTGFDVTPVLGVIPPDLPLVPNPGEVESWFEVPLSVLFDRSNYTENSTMWKGAERRYYEMHWEGYRIWGVTAAIIFNLSRRLDITESFGG